MTRGAIAAGDPQTVEAGVWALRAGGNAVDAVCAASFAAFVVEAPLCSPAGAGALLTGADRSAFRLLDFFAAAPGLGAADPSPTDFHEISVDFGSAIQHFHVGRGAAAVPGALLGLVEAHRQGGTQPLGDLLEPAVRLATQGYTLSAPVHYVFDLLRPIVTLTPGVRAIFCDGDDIAKPGATLTNPELGAFLEALGRDPEGVTHGRFYDALAQEMGPEHGGLITPTDLQRYQVAVRAPLRVEFGPYEILTNPPPSSGGGLIALGLSVIEALGLADHGFLAAEHVASIAAAVEVMSAARADGYDARIAEPGGLEKVLDRLPQWGDRARRKQQSLLGSTTHISVIDGVGGAASLTMSNGEGCGHVLPGLGIHVNNFLGEDDINPDGFHRIPAGRRMSTMMAPTIVLHDGQPHLVLGSGGSNRIRSAILQALVNVLVFDQPIERAVNAPRLHVDGEALWFERKDLPEASAHILEHRWPQASIFDSPNMFFGGVHAVGRDGDRLVGGGDRRRGGHVGFA